VAEIDGTLDSATLGSSVRQGARWQMAAQAIEVAVGLGLLIYLAHVVGAHTFGIVAFAIALTAVASAVLSGPVNSAVIAHRLVSERESSTAWWAATVPSALFAAALSGALLAAGVRGSGLVAIAVVAASMPLLGSSALVQAILQQRLEFRAVANGRIVAAVGSSALAVGLGASGLGLAALLSRALSAPLLIVCVGMVQARWRPRLIIDRPTLRAVVTYGRGVAGFGLLNQLNRYSDNLLVGFILGSTVLGFYSLAYRFIETPVAQVGGVAQSVVFPALVRVDDEQRFREALLRSQKVLVWVVAPLGICSIAVGDIAVRTVLGNQWSPAGIIVQVFGAVALLQIAGTQVGVIYLARNATPLLMRWALFATPVIVGSFAIGLVGGIRGVAWAYFAANLILFYPSWAYPGRLIGLTGAMVLRNLRFVLGAAFGLAGAMLALRLATPLDSVPVLIAVAVSLPAIYWTITAIVDGELRTDVRQLIDMRRGSTSTPGTTNLKTEPLG
jgi:O-antigen/teichoic acid export membrane protein